MADFTLDRIATGERAVQLGENGVQDEAAILGAGGLLLW
jgi:hypothetical protein